MTQSRAPGIVVRARRVVIFSFVPRKTAIPQDLRNALGLELAALAYALDAHQAEAARRHLALTKRALAEMRTLRRLARQKAEAEKARRTSVPVRRSRRTAPALPSPS